MDSISFTAFSKSGPNDHATSPAREATSREVRLFWTGGWDSTFRLLQLSQEQGIDVRPMYIRDNSRPSMRCELASMAAILPDVRAMSKARVLNVELYDRSAILRDLPDKEISDAYDRLADQFKLGYQYQLFALLCKGLGIRVECGIENSPRSLARAAIEAQCLLVPCEEEPLGGAKRLRAVSKGEVRDAELVLGCLDLGILGVSKVEARRISEKMGWMPIMRKTWFCYTPVEGRPCGVCGPCQDAMNEGMRWRIPLSSQLRYYARSLREKAGRRIG